MANVEIEPGSSLAVQIQAGHDSVYRGMASIFEGRVAQGYFMQKGIVQQRQVQSAWDKYLEYFKGEDKGLADVVAEARKWAQQNIFDWAQVMLEDLD